MKNTRYFLTGQHCFNMEVVSNLRFNYRPDRIHSQRSEGAQLIGNRLQLIVYRYNIRSENRFDHEGIEVLLSTGRELTAYAVKVHDAAPLEICRVFWDSDLKFVVREKKYFIFLS